MQDFARIKKIKHEPVFNTHASYQSECANPFHPKNNNKKDKIELILVVATGFEPG